MKGTQRSLSEIKTTIMVTCTADATVKEAVDLLDEHRAKLLVVVDGPGYLAGVVSQTDVLRSWRQGGAYEDVMAQPVRSIMTKAVVTCMPHMTIEKAAKTLTEHGIHHLVLVQEQNDGRLWPAGIVSTWDIVRAVGDEI